MELHKHSLAFPLDDLAALSSTQLALVQFHPEASPLVEERARVEFVRRRAAWLEREKQKLEAEEKPVVAVKQEVVDAGVTALAGGASVEDLGAVKKEATEVLTLDDDDEEVEVFTLPKKGKAPKEVRKRKASLSGSPSSASKRSRAAVVALNPTPTPTPPPPQPKIASILSGLSFRKKKSSAPVDANPAIDHEPLPFGLPGVGTTGTPPEPSPKPKAARPVVEFPVDLLYRSSRRQSSPPPTVPARPALVIAPNPLLSRALTQNMSVPKDEADHQFLFRPPPSFPVFSPFPPNAAEKGTDPLPTALVDKFVTVAFDGLSTSVIKELLLRFLYRNQHRLARRPLAIMRSAHFEEEQQWKDVGWTWDATSEEVRKIWWKARDIPYSRVCPRYDASKADERIISDEYHSEADRILSRTTPVGFARDLAQYLHEEKEVVYDERRSAWIRWTERSDKEEALAAGEKEPEWPTWPNDAAVILRATKRLLAGIGRWEAEADRLAEEKRDKQILVSRERLFASRQSIFAPAAVAISNNAITSTSLPVSGITPWETSSTRPDSITLLGTATAQATSAVPSTPPKTVVSPSAPPPPRKSTNNAFPF